jgi:hypothetical protein
MKPRRVENWTVEKLHRARPKISFPEYQRQPNLWSTDKRQLLIDSMLRDIDIPKIYFNETKDGDFEVVDGTQRLWSIWEFIDDELPIEVEGESKTFSELPKKEQDKIRNFTLQVVIFEDVDDEYLRELFLRLQLGLLLVTGEKLHATTGMMKDFVFDKLSAHKFIRTLKIPNRRYAKETLAAQIAINSFTRAKLGGFARTRYEDLLSFFNEYERPPGRDLDFFRKQSKVIIATLDGLWDCVERRTAELSNRSYVLSVYLLFEEIGSGLTTVKDQKKFVDFVFALWRRLRQEVSAGIDRKNRELYAFEAMLSSASGERYQIERRHQKMREYYEHFRHTGNIKGD